MDKVWVNGTFDVLHRGHIELLKYASSFGLVRVGIDSDRRVKELKGHSRPINNLKDRMLMMESLKFVDSVVSFDSDIELQNQIQVWDPHYLIIGSDYQNKPIIGSHLIKEIIYFDRIEGYSSTQKINQINERFS